jgi:CRISPR type II-A-associated protein Csn2
MVSFDFLTKPIELNFDKVNVLYIENQHLYRNTIFHFYNGCLEESNIVFSENYNPISSAFMKKMYEDVSIYINTFLLENMSSVKSEILTLLENLSAGFDYDFEFKDDVDIVDLLKMQSFKPSLSKENLLSTLLDFIILMNKYSSVKCFVLLNLHNYFDLSELEILYKELSYQNINLLVIENKKCFETLSAEKVYIVDEDMCEIIEN